MRTGRPKGQKNRPNHRAGRPRTQPTLAKDQTTLNFARQEHAEASTSASASTSNAVPSEQTVVDELEWDDVEWDDEAIEELESIEQSYVQQPEQVQDEEQSTIFPMEMDLEDSNNQGH
jgi:hypothetical protein